MKLTLSWLSIISFTLNILLAGLGLYQYLDSKKQEDNLKMVVRSWQNQAEGLSSSIANIAFNPQNYSSKEDMAQAVQVVSSYAYSLNSALAQQRFYTDSEVKLQKEAQTKEIQKFFNQYKSTSSVKSPK